MRALAWTTVALIALVVPARADPRLEIENRAACIIHEGADLPVGVKLQPAVPGEPNCDPRVLDGNPCPALDPGTADEALCLKTELGYWEGVLDRVTDKRLGAERRPGQRAAIASVVKSFRAYRQTYCASLKLITVNPPDSRNFPLECALRETIRFARDDLYPAIYSP